MRVFLAFLLSPLVAVLAVFVGISVTFILVGEGVDLHEPFNGRFLLIVFAIGAPIAWAVTLVAGLPAWFVNRGVGTLTRRLVLQVATAAGAITLAAFGYAAPTDWRVLGALLGLAVGAAAGALAGATFSRIAAVPPE